VKFLLSILGKDDFAEGSKISGYRFENISVGPSK